MIEPLVIITNNRLVLQKLGGSYETIAVDGTLMDVLVNARDHIHRGHRLLTHPLMGSVKPNETPFKTVLISRANGQTTDMDSLVMIEASIATAKKLLDMKKPPDWPDRILDDFRLIDYDLILNAIS